MPISQPFCLAGIDTKSPEIVSEIIADLYRQTFPQHPTDFIHQWVRCVSAMFRGEFEQYQAMDTVYHDLEHTLQATLCLVRLLCHRHLLRVEPLMCPRDFEIALVAILMHDTGYLKNKEDRVGTGAKFTFVHERRSCEFASDILEKHNWPQNDILQVQHLISCTGPRSVIAAIPFYTEMEKILGLAVCTSDYLGQMSDPGYVEKLPPLFREFEESDDYRGVPQDKRLFQSAQEMLQKTPAFWRKIVLPKLQGECQGLYHFLSVPYPDGPNTYLAAVEKNISRIEHDPLAALSA